MKFRILILFTLTAILSSLLRFGERENNLSTLSDSDYYLDMARVFAGQQYKFNPDFLASAAHHYNRPLLPFLAGKLGRTVLNNNYAAAFSIINILSAILIAFLFFVIIVSFYPEIKFAWYPSLLFLTAFPQMDFGYHILTETIGLAFAIGTCLFLYILLKRIEERVAVKSGYLFYKDKEYLTGVLVLFAIQSLSWLARETAFFAVIFFIYIALRRKLYRTKYLYPTLIIFLVLVVSKIPHWMYSQLYHTHVPLMVIKLKVLTDPSYILDFIFKLGLTFNISWIIIVLSYIFLSKIRLLRIHDFIVGWTVAALGYIAAGFVHNSIQSGFPLRMFFSLFPLIYIVVIHFLEYWISPRRLNYALVIFFIFHIAIGITGVLIDSGYNTIHTIFDFHKTF